MAPIIDRIINLLVLPQGHLVYSLLMCLAVFGALQASIYAVGRKASAEGKRMRRGLITLLLAQVVLFVAAWLVWLGVIHEHSYLPPIDRVVALFSLVVIIWLWAFPERNPVVDGVVIALEGMVVIAVVSSMVWWLGQNSGLFFNTTMLGAYAYYSGIGLLAAGLIVLLWKRPKSWGFGLLMFVIMLLGYLAQLSFRQPEGDYAGLVRLGEMVAYIVLLALPRRLVVPAQAREYTRLKASVTVPSRMDARSIQSVINLSTEKTDQRYYQGLTQLLAQLMDADTCLLVIPPKEGSQIIVPLGFSMLKDQAVDGFTLDGRKMPYLLESIFSGKTLVIDGSHPDSEVRTLTRKFGVNETAHLLMVPFKLNASDPGLGIMVLSKPSQPLWGEEDVTYLTEVIKVLASASTQHGDASLPGAAQDETLKKLGSAQALAEEYRLQYAHLKAQYDSLSAQATRVVNVNEGADGGVENLKNLQETTRQLEMRNRELESLLNKGRPSFEEVDQLRQELRAALADLARVPATLSRSDQKMLEQQLSAIKQLDDLGPEELVTSIAQEFRQPLSAIVGYTELLLGESAGLLGAMQRKFLERVRASSERLATLINDLVQVLVIDGGNVDQTQARVDLEALIDEAVGNINAQISEKNITLRVDLPEKILPVVANKEALFQILANLLQNACLVTPVDGEIRLFARMERKDNETQYILISVTDQGGGIEKADIPRVFSRRYKVENPLIQGVGDTGVGLSIVKSLAELSKGRVWVDVNEGVGSTFSVLLPSVENQPGTENQPAS